MNWELLSTLCNIDGVSGHESAVRTYIIEQLQQSSGPMDMHTDAMGNLLVHLKGKAPAEKVVQFDAHMDEVGFIVTHICDDGTLRFSNIGGINSDVLYGHRVRIGNTIGVIGGKAMHMCGSDEMKKVPSGDSLRIDIGALSKEEAEKKVRVGECGTFDADFMQINPTIFRGKAVDDRVGCMLLLEMAKVQPERDVWLSFSTQEEIGLRGAGVASEQIKPDYVIAIDATTAADTAGSDEANAVCHVGKGAVVSFADGATLYDADLYQRIRELADDAGIPTQTKNKIAGGNNAGAMQRRGNGAYAAAISLPCRYIHSPACMGSGEDVDAMFKLLTTLSVELTK